MMSTSFDLISGVLLLLILIVSISIHEWAHSWVAEKLGDATPRLDGRNTLNPAAHFDPLGTFLMPMIFIFILGSQVPFGWGKRIDINPSAFENPKRDEILVWLAGPGGNALVALVAAILGGLTFSVVPKFHELMIMFIQVNCLIIIINLLPVPPLDGGFILKVLSNMSEELFIRLSYLCFVILLGLFFFEPTRVVITLAQGLIEFLFFFIMSGIASLMV